MRIKDTLVSVHTLHDNKRHAFLVPCQIDEQGKAHITAQQYTDILSAAGVNSNTLFSMGR